MENNDYEQFKEGITNSWANDSDSTFDSDAPLPANAEFQFYVSGGRVRLQLDGLTHTIRRVSDLPGVDRVVRPSDSTRLSSIQVGLYEEFTAVLVSNRIFFRGPFHCASRITGANQNSFDAEVIGDRPVPVFADYVDPMLPVDRVMSFGLGRTRGRRLMHCTPGGHHNAEEYVNEKVIYLGSETERMADAAATGMLELHERLCTHIREFSTEIVSLSPLATCGTDRIQASYHSVCNCFYCRNHSPISWSLEIIYRNKAGHKRWTLIESLSFFDGGMGSLRAAAPEDGGPFTIIAGRLDISHNGRLERWAVKQSRTADLEMIAARNGFTDHDKLLFTVINAAFWATMPSKCYLGGNSVYDPDHYAPCASEVMGVTFWYTPSGSWVTVGGTLVFNDGLYHLRPTNNDDDIAEVRDIRPDVKVVGKPKHS